MKKNYQIEQELVDRCSVVVLEAEPRKLKASSCKQFLFGDWLVVVVVTDGAHGI